MVHRILIVDDEAEARFSLPLPLEDAGYTVATAADGQEALALIESDPQIAELLILDIEMPRMTGLQLLDALQEREIMLPCIVISGYGDKATIVELLRRGVDDFLDKPFHEQDLLQAITTVQHKWSQRQEALTATLRRQPPEPSQTPFYDDDDEEPAAAPSPAQVTAGWDLQCREGDCELHLFRGIAAADAEALRSALLACLDHGDRRFTCDMAGLDDLHPVLLSVLLRFADLLREQELPPLRLAGFGSHLSQFFHITNAADQFHISLEDLP